MQIQIKTDHNVKNSHELIPETEFQQMIQDSLRHFGNRITRVDVHFKDEDAGKSGVDDKRCLIEASVSGFHPIVAKHYARDLHLALKGATEKLKHSLEHALEKR